MFVKITSMQNSDKSFQFIKCSTLSSTKNIIKSPGNSIHYHCEEICSWMRRPENTEKKEKTKFLQWPTTVLLPNFLKIFPADKTYEGIYISPTFLSTASMDQTFQNLKKHIPSGKHLKEQQDEFLIRPLLIGSSVIVQHAYL